MSDQDIPRDSMEVDIVCVGFGPAAGGFLTTLARGLTNPDGTPAVESTAMPGMPPQVICYERADGIGFGVSGIVTRARSIRATFPDLDPAQIPMAHPVKHEKVLYLLDPIGASNRSRTVRMADAAMRGLRFALPLKDDAIELPYIPPFLCKDGGLLLSIGQFNQWVGEQLMAEGAVQIWPGTPVSKALIEEDRVTGVQLLDQGVDKQGNPEPGFMPGMNIKAALTVIADGPVGAVGRQVDDHFGLPPGHEQKDWAVGMKMVVQLPDDCELEAGMVLHTFGYPEPEIFGFLYVYPDRTAAVGIFVPSSFQNPVRTSYRYLQHYIMHPYLWRYLEGSTLLSWGAKSLQESGKHGEPFLAGDGYARIGEGSGSTNVLTGSGVDEAWATGTQLAEGVLELLKQGKPFTQENLEASYVKRRRASWVETEGLVAEKARDGFHHSVITGLIGMGLTGLTNGRISIPGKAKPLCEVPNIYDFFEGRIPETEVAHLRRECEEKGLSLHDALMDRCGWPQIPYDGKLLISHQDALLLGGKVQAPAGYADHVVFLYPTLCETCGTQVCVEVCSGQAITPGTDGVPAFDREKCIHCGACVWNCTQPLEDNPDKSNLVFKAGPGGLHSAQN